MSSNQNKVYHLVQQLSMVSNTTSKQLVYLYTRGIIASDLNCPRLPKKRSLKWRRWACALKSASPWASPLHMTPKNDGTWRPCGDYRRLSIITKPDHYAMPNISDLTSSISTARIFSNLDLPKGYFQVPVNPNDVPKTAITTPFGTYMFHYSTFGLRNSGTTFLWMMD